jgi:serine/threonine protein kinase
MLYDVGEAVEPTAAAAPRSLVRKYGEGSTLDQAGPLETPSVLVIATQVCDAPEAAHARSLVHRDVKPSNIMLTGWSGDRDQFRWGRVAPRPWWSGRLHSGVRTGVGISSAHWRLALRAVPMAGGPARRLTSFSRDGHAPEGGGRRCRRLQSLQLPKVGRGDASRRRSRARSTPFRVKRRPGRSRTVLVHLQMSTHAIGLPMGVGETRALVRRSRPPQWPRPTDRS